MFGRHYPGKIGMCELMACPWWSFTSGLSVCLHVCLCVRARACAWMDVCMYVCMKVVVSAIWSIFQSAAMGIMHSVLSVNGHQAHFEFIAVRWDSIYKFTRSNLTRVFDRRSCSQKAISHLFSGSKNEDKLISRCIVFLYNLIEFVLEMGSIALFIYSLVTRGMSG